MTYNIFNSENGSAMEMFFDCERQLKRWLEDNPAFVNLGKNEYTLPTRHVRMQNKND
tara:strand:- start:37 stop:207 length:171 start_codon:yes stop_codon:yes gene_type:complete